LPEPEVELDVVELELLLEDELEELVLDEELLEDELEELLEDELEELEELVPEVELDELELLLEELELLLEEELPEPPIGIEHSLTPPAIRPPKVVALQTKLPLSTLKKN
jgi:hypothetical protein